MSLPSLRTKPSYKDLLKILTGLEVKPRSWDEIPTQDLVDQPTFDEEDVQAFLLGLFKTDFWWFEDLDGVEVITAQQQVDDIVDLASRRLAERCGRSARGQDTRTFHLDVIRDHDIVSSNASHTAALELSIREPPLTGDNLGLKTWGSAWTMVQLLPDIGTYPPLKMLLDRQRQNKLENRQSHTSVLQVLELGAGTGLVGMAAAALWGVNVVLTDLPVIHENLLYNINANLPSISNVSDGSALAEILDWSDHSSALSGWARKEFEVILAVDPLYDDNHPRLLADTVRQFLKHGAGHFVLTAVPFRDSTTESLCAELEALMEGYRFAKIKNGDNICRDDWESANAQEVMVRWALWSSPDKPL